MNFQDLKKKSMQSQGEEPSWEEIEQKAIENNPAIRELDVMESEALRQARTISLTKALAISNENYINLKRDQELSLKEIQATIGLLTAKIEKLEESNQVLAVKIAAEVGKTQTQANNTIVELKNNVLAEMSRGANVVIQDMRTISNQALQYYENRRTMDMMIGAAVLVNIILTTYIFIKIWKALG